MSEVSSHEANSLSAYLRVVRRRKWIIIACVIVLPVTAYILSAVNPLATRPRPRSTSAPKTWPVR